jgi:hypothetical protein
MSRRLIALVTIVAGSVFGLAGTAAAGPAPPFPHCVTPGGIDLNEALPSAQPIVSFFCTTVPARTPWRAATSWFGASTNEAVYPPGYVPKKATPIEDFIVKFAHARYVVDPGTQRERTFTFDAKNLRRRRPPDGILWASEPLRALEAGTHVVDIHVFLWAEHWDGVDVDPVFNRLPAGWTFFERIEFTVE